MDFLPASMPWPRYTSNSRTLSSSLPPAERIACSTPLGRHVLGDDDGDVELDGGEPRRLDERSRAGRVARTSLARSSSNAETGASASNRSSTRGCSSPIQPTTSPPTSTSARTPGLQPRLLGDAHLEALDGEFSGEYLQHCPWRRRSRAARRARSTIGRLPRSGQHPRQHRALLGLLASLGGEERRPDLVEVDVAHAAPLVVRNAADEPGQSDRRSTACSPDIGLSTSTSSSPSASAMSKRSRSVGSANA